MVKFKCPECGVGTMTEHVIPLHHTRYCGKHITVRDAVIAECRVCRRISVSALELKRWRAIAEAMHEHSVSVFG